MWHRTLPRLAVRSCGIIGAPEAGKASLFAVLTRGDVADAQVPSLAPPTNLWKDKSNIWCDQLDI